MAPPLIPWRAARGKPFMDMVPFCLCHLPLSCMGGRMARAAMQWAAWCAFPATGYGNGCPDNASRLCRNLHPSSLHLTQSTAPVWLVLCACAFCADLVNRLDRGGLCGAIGRRADLPVSPARPRGGCAGRARVLAWRCVATQCCADSACACGGGYGLGPVSGRGLVGGAGWRAGRLVRV